MPVPEFTLSAFEEIRDGVRRAVAQPEAVTVGLVTGERGSLVIDTGSSPAQGAAIRAAAEHATGLPVLAAVATHWHFDHFFGLSAFADLPTFGHESLAARLDDPELAREAAALGVSVGSISAPNTPFHLARVVDLGDRRVELVHFGPGHTEGDVVAIVPDAQVVFCGDLLEQAAPPSFGPDCRIRSWASTLDGVLGLLGPDSLVVPGHGDPFDRFFAFNQRAQISAVHGQVEYLISQGIGLTEAAERGEWPFDRAVVERLLPVAYAQLSTGAGKVRRRLPLA